MSAILYFAYSHSNLCSSDFLSLPLSSSCKFLFSLISFCSIFLVSFFVLTFSCIFLPLISFYYHVLARFVSCVIFLFFCLSYMFVFILHFHSPTYHSCFPSSLWFRCYYLPIIYLSNSSFQCFSLLICLFVVAWFSLLLCLLCCQLFYIAIFMSSYFFILESSSSIFVLSIHLHFILPVVLFLFSLTDYSLCFLSFFLSFCWIFNPSLCIRTKTQLNYKIEYESDDEPHCE